jgi:hypothetical protein
MSFSYSRPMVVTISNCPPRNGYYRITQLTPGIPTSRSPLSTTTTSDVMKYSKFLISPKNKTVNPENNTHTSTNTGEAIQSIKNMCLSLIEKDKSGSTNSKIKFSNIDDLSSWFNKYMIGAISTLVGDTLIKKDSPLETRRVTIVSNLYMMISMFVATLKVVGFDFKLADTLTSDTHLGGVLDLTYKGVMTLCAMSVIKEPKGIVLTLPQYGLFNDPMSTTEQCMWGGAFSCDINKYDGFYKDLTTVDADDYLEWLECVHDTARENLNALLRGLALL